VEIAMAEIHGMDLLEASGYVPKAVVNIVEGAEGVERRGEIAIVTPVKHHHEEASAVLAGDAV